MWRKAGFQRARWRKTFIGRRTILSPAHAHTPNVSLHFIPRQKIEGAKTRCKTLGEGYYRLDQSSRSFSPASHVTQSVTWPSILGSTYKKALSMKKTTTIDSIMLAEISMEAQHLWWRRRVLGDHQRNRKTAGVAFQGGVARKANKGLLSITSRILVLEY